MTGRYRQTEIGTVSRISTGIRAGLFFLLACALPASVGAAPFAAYVMDARTGKQLYSQNADTRLHPASLTKMMTLYLAFTAIERGQIRLDTKIPISQHAANQPPSRLGLKAGQRIELRYLIRAAAVKSANDAATAIAEGLGGGSETYYAQQMTNMARALGMNSTQFRNAHGLTADGHYSTARDMTVLGRRLFYDFPQYYNLFSRRSADAGIANVSSTNKRFLDNYKGADGIKTGYTRAAGFNLTASAQRGQKRLVATVMGGQSTAHRNEVMGQLLDSGFGKAPNQVRESRPQPPQYMVEQRTNRTNRVARAEPRQQAPAPFRLSASARPAARSNSASLLPAPAASPAPPPAVQPAAARMVAGTRPQRNPRGHAPAVIATKSATDMAVGMALAARPEAPPEEGDSAGNPAALSSSARPARRAGRGKDEVSALSPATETPRAGSGSLFNPAALPPPESVTLAASTTPVKRSESIILAAMQPDAPEEREATEIISRVNSSGRGNWGVDIGLYRSQSEAEQVLLQTALQESTTLDSATRRVINTNRGFEARFVGLSGASAELACERLGARQIPCRILRP